MNRRKIVTTIVLSVCLTSSLPFNMLYQRQTVSVVEAATKKQFKLTDKQYKKVKGWWSYNSSGGVGCQVHSFEIKIL